ncbi:hypothetical protein BDR07DRAFT_1372419 [Suillus spraguei]|nr:hypothetical protein BDR07DRAFT_1372419 [Suillus spraguei]
MSSPGVEVKCFSQCVADSIYDRVTDAIISLGKDGLGEADFRINWTTTIQDNYSGTSWSYVNTKDGCPFRTNIIGQIATSTCGTKHSAKGTHFTKKGSKINACITKSANDLQYADLIVLTSQCIYEKPEGVNANQNATPRQTKRKIVEDSMVEQQSMAASMSSMATSSTNMNIPTPPPDKVTPGALYNPRILPDYCGSYFQLRQNKLKQLNIYDSAENGGKLIPMHKTYSKLRPRTLILAVCDAHIYNMTFQLGVQAIKVLDPSDEPVEERMITVFSTMSINMSKDDSAIAGFSTFDVAISPSKKNKHTNGQKNKGGKGKEKEKMD